MTRLVAACPDTKFVGMGMATTHDNDAGRWLAFHRDYQAANGPALHAWGFHMYERPTTVWYQQAEAAKIALNNTCPLWITEYGTDLPGDEAQSAHILDVVTNAGSLGVARTYQYAYWDGTDTGFGLVTANDTHRPAWDTLHSLL
jgi:hypothetical protein